MVHISFTDTLPQDSDIAVIKHKNTALRGAYKELNPLLESIHFEKSAVFANVCGASCVYVIEQSDDTTARQLGSMISQEVKKSETLFVDAQGMSVSDIADMAMGVRLKCYVFDTYKTITKKQTCLKNIIFVCNNIQAVKQAYVRVSAVADGICVARDVVNEPANILNPVTYAKRTESLRTLGVKVTVMKPAELAKLGMGALLGVAQGSKNPARVVVMEWYGGNAGDAPFAFVGKGVTFDTGGISLKPAEGMEDMKMDMGGAAAVYGALHSIATRKAKANVIGVIGLVENMPGGKAQRPGDIVTSMSGQTIEVLNTDAEGRLVLADCLTFVQQKYTPKSIVNLATLTGAIMVALGTDYAGLFSNNDDFAIHVLGVSKNAGEKLWYMPMSDVFDKQIDSPVADMKNISSGRWGGASTAAAFLSRFVDDAIPWVHMDIAGTAFAKKAKAFSPAGGTGFGVATLDRLVYEFEMYNG